MTISTAAPASPDDQATALSLAERVRCEQMQALFTNRVGVNVVAFGVSLLFWLACYARLRQPWIPVWGVALHLTQLLPIPWYRSFFGADPRGQIDPRWVTRLNRILMASAVLWAMAPWLMMPPSDLPMTAVVVILMIGIISGSVASLASFSRVLFTFTAPVTLSLCLALLRRADALHAFLALAVLAYVGVTLRFAVRQHRLIADALAMRFEKEALVERLGQQIEATERASQEKTRFLATASHDLRQPLHAIALFGATLEHQLGQTGCAEPRLAAELMRGVNALSASFDTLLDISRLDAGVVVPDHQPVLLNELFLELDRIFSPGATAKGLQLRVRATPLAVRSDPQLLLRLLSNLVDNAIKYTPRGGVIVLARERGAQVWIDVLDTGIGIADEHAGRIFDEFYQVGNPGRDRRHGLGIGLSIVQRLSHLLGLSVRMHSRAGVGSRFRVVLPRAAWTAREPLPPPAPPQAPAERPSRVLILDDEASILQAMRDLLVGHGLHAEASATEDEAARALERARAQGQAFDVLVCDLRLAQGANGLEAGQRLQQRFGPGLALLLVTGETAPVRLRQVREAGVSVLYKPVQAPRLLDAISKVRGSA